jgi:hypothetical protein
MLESDWQKVPRIKLFRRVGNFSEFVTKLKRNRREEKGRESRKGSEVRGKGSGDFRQSRDLESWLQTTDRREPKEAKRSQLWRLESICTWSTALNVWSSPANRHEKSLNSWPEFIQNTISTIKIRKPFIVGQPHFVKTFNLFSEYHRNRSTWFRNPERTLQFSTFSLVRTNTLFLFKLDELDSGCISSNNDFREIRLPTFVFNPWFYHLSSEILDFSQDNSWVNGYFWDPCISD